LALGSFFKQPEKAQAGLNTTTIKASYHNWTDSGFPTIAHYNGQPYMNTGFMSGSNRKFRSWIYFNLSNIPAGATINSASLNLWIKNNSGGVECSGMPTNRGLVVGQVFSSWGDWTNWNNQPTYINPAIYDLTRFPCDGQERFYYINTTQIVKNWFESGQTNYGFVILADEVGDTWSRGFTSSIGSEAEKPQLFIQYTTPDAPATPGTPATQPAASTSTNTGSETVTTTNPTVNPNLKSTDPAINPPTLSFVTIAGTKSDAPLSGDLPIVIGDNLIVGGKATKGQTISLAIGDKAFSGEVNAEGNWEITIDTSTFKTGVVKAKAQAQNLKTNKGSKEVELFGLQVSEKKTAETVTETPKNEIKEFGLKDWLLLGGLVIALALAVLALVFRKKIFKYLENRKRS